MFYGLLIVEGQHDLQFCVRLLRLRGMKQLVKFEDLAPQWSLLVPREHPYKGELGKRVPVPTFLSSDTHSIAVRPSEGDSSLGRQAKDDRFAFAGELNALGILLDADRKIPAAKRYTELCDDLLKQASLTLAHQPGAVLTDGLRRGAFVMPDNQSPGTLEQLLLACGEHAYPSLLAKARSYVDSLDRDVDLAGRDAVSDCADDREFRKGAGPDKAVCAAMVAALKPGRTIGVSLQDNRWVTDETRKLPLVQPLDTFLTTLFDLPS